MPFWREEWCGKRIAPLRKTLFDSRASAQPRNVWKGDPRIL
jgi:hypothetical protein